MKDGCEQKSRCQYCRHSAVQKLVQQLAYNYKRYSGIRKNTIQVGTVEFKFALEQQ
jgi:hypothetical protein